MSFTSFAQTAGSLTEGGPANALAPTFEIQPLPVACDQRRASRQRRSIGMLVGTYCGWAEFAILALLSWLGSLVITGLIHCAFAHHAGDPDLLRRPQDTRARPAAADRPPSQAPRR